MKVYYEHMVIFLMSNHLSSTYIYDPLLFTFQSFLDSVLFYICYYHQVIFESVIAVYTTRNVYK